MTSQPRPTPNGHPFIADMVIQHLQDSPHLGSNRHAVAEHIRARMQAGIAEYGTPLQPWNGRIARRDWYEELLDAVQYGQQDLYELSHDRPDDPDLPVLRSMFEDLVHMCCALAGMRAGQTGTAGGDEAR